MDIKRECSSFMMLSVTTETITFSSSLSSVLSPCGQSFMESNIRDWKVAFLNTVIGRKISLVTSMDGVLVETVSKLLEIKLQLA